jgi:hypothetical protein
MTPEEPVEEVDAVVVAEDASGRALARRPEAGAVVARNAAAVAVTSFAAGLATVAVGRALQGRRARRRAAVPVVVATRSFLVDVHVLAPGRRP